MMRVRDEGTPSEAAELVSVMDAASVQRIRAELAPHFAGDILDPLDPAYEGARRLWNAMIEAKPALILRCARREDVAGAIRVAASLGLKVSVRAGGHGVGGMALIDGGVVIDLSRMRDVTVDLTSGIATVAGGALLQDLDQVTAAHARVVPAGVMSETGVGGLALGGGVGALSRLYGATCDQVDSFEVVTADGSVLDVHEGSHSDLNWALRGGGGNFGVVTAFRFRTRRFPTDIRIGISFYEPDQAAQALREYGRLYPDQPDHVNWVGILKTNFAETSWVPAGLHGRPGLVLITKYLLDPHSADAKDTVETLTAIGKPAFRESMVWSFSREVQRMNDVEFASGGRYYTKQGRLENFDAAVIDRLVQAWRQLKIHGEIEILGQGGQFARTDPALTAFANRHHFWWLNFAARWEEPSADLETVQAIHDAFASVSPWFAAGTYVNVLAFDQADRVVEAYGGEAAFERLVAVKRKYDPTNMFKGNGAIPVNWTRTAGVCA